eukprot:16129028-Heterocapsa_arctica.AAC.1
MCIRDSFQFVSPPLDIFDGERPDVVPRPVPVEPRSTACQHGSAVVGERPAEEAVHVLEPRARVRLVQEVPDTRAVPTMIASDHLAVALERAEVEDIHHDERGLEQDVRGLPHVDVRRAVELHLAKRAVAGELHARET